MRVITVILETMIVANGLPLLTLHTNATPEEAEVSAKGEQEYEIFRKQQEEANTGWHIQRPPESSFWVLHFQEGEPSSLAECAFKNGSCRPSRPPKQSCRSWNEPRGPLEGSQADGGRR